jgi:flagellar biosynthetic protein FlhB
VADRGERTEKPTGRRLDKARKEGNVPRSTEVPSTLGLAAILLFSTLAGNGWLGKFRSIGIEAWSHLSHSDLDASELIVVLGSNLLATAALLVGPLGAMTFAGLAGNVLQGRPPLTLKPLKPKLSKIDPVKGFKKVFSLGKLSELIRTIIKLVLFTSVAYMAGRSVILHGSPGTPGAGGTMEAFGAVGRRMLSWVVALAALIAVLDVMFQRWNHVRGLKMTKKEIKDERRETDGDPQVKLKIRQKQLAMARSRMMAEVPEATVVVTNPTHFAVALKFTPGEMDVPKLVAKGRAKLAQRIREIATAHGVPIVHNPPLARALYKSVPLGAEIPAALFRAVAEVLALVLRPRSRRGNRPAGVTP